MARLDNDYMEIFAEWQNIPTLRDKYAFLTPEQGERLQERIIEKYYMLDGEKSVTPRHILQNIDIEGYNFDDEMKGIFDPLKILPEEIIFAVSYWAKNAVCMQFQTFASHFWEIYDPLFGAVGVTDREIKFLLYIEDEVIRYCELPKDDDATETLPGT